MLDALKRRPSFANVMGALIDDVERKLTLLRETPELQGVYDDRDDEEQDERTTEVKMYGVSDAQMTLIFEQFNNSGPARLLFELAREDERAAGDALAHLLATGDGGPLNATWDRLGRVYGFNPHGVVYTEGDCGIMAGQVPV